MNWKKSLLIICFLLWGTLLFAGSYAPKVGESDSSAISKDDSNIIAWATGWENLTYGTNVDSEWKTPAKAIGASTGSTLDIVSLGQGGTITLTFAKPIKNDEGWDFAVFENSFDGDFLELAYVEISSNGTDFIRFDNDSQISSAVSEFGTIDATEIDGFAGKYQVGYGTPFDLRDLATDDAVINGNLNLSAITHVKIVDIVGDGTYLDTSNEIIYDPYPSTGSAGFDLEAVGIRYQNNNTSNTAPKIPSLKLPADQSVDNVLTAELTTENFTDPDTDEIHLLTQWKISADNSFGTTYLVLNSISSQYLTQLNIPSSILSADANYSWRTLFYDNGGLISSWSPAFEFRTTSTSASTDTISVDWDNDGSPDTDIKSVNAINSDGTSVKLGIKATENISDIETIEVLDISGTRSTNRPSSLTAGLVSFRLKITDTDKVAKLTVYLESAAQADAKWYQYSTISGWQEYSQLSFNADRTQVTLLFQDGSDTSGDTDGAKNGLIVSAGGINSTLTSSTTNDEEGVGSSGGCFISSVETTNHNGLFIGILVIVSACFFILGIVES